MKRGGKWVAVPFNLEFLWGQGMSYNAIAPRMQTRIDAAAANADAYAIFPPARYAGRVDEVEITPMAAINTTDTESRTFNLYNRGPAGSGTTLVATLALVAAVADKVDNVPFTLTLSATAANRVVAAGDVLELESLHVGSTGLAAPVCMATVKLARTL